MSIPTARPEIVPQRALAESTLASDALSRELSSFDPAIPAATHVPPIQATKRKASDMENLERPQAASQTCPPIKQEPGSPHRFDHGGSTTRDTHPELHQTLTRYASSSRSDDTEDQRLDSHEDDGTTTLGPSRKLLAAQGRLDMSFRDMSIPLKQESDTCTPRATLDKNDGGINGLLRPLPFLDNVPPPRQQNSSARPGVPRRINRNKIEDVAYNSVPEYSPPISTLPRDNPHILQVEWRKKSFIDLSNDPDRHMLHEAEVMLATSLSLSCAKYLCTKRRIFQARLEALLAGRDFKKTDSQKACKIDTNKASKMCGAFEKVGWFDEKYFLKYIDESNIPSRRATEENKDRESPSSGLTVPDIWDVSESGFHFTSEEDDESTDDDTANSSVSLDSRYGETEGRSILDSRSQNSLTKQKYGVSLIGGDGSQRRVLDDKTIQNDDSLSGDENIEGGLTMKGTRPRRQVTAQGTTYPANSGRISRDETEETPLLETRSRTQKIKLALNSHSGDKIDRGSILEANNSQQNMTLENVPRRSRNPIPHSLDEANAADVMLVKMKEKGRSWLEIEEAWENITGKAQTTKTLSGRYCRIMANLARTRNAPEVVRGSHRSQLTYPLLEPDDGLDSSLINHPTSSSLKRGQLLLAAEAEVEEKFQREKADLIGEIENNFQLEKWNLVAEAMSRTGSAKYSAEKIQAQYDRLAGGLERAEAKEENPDSFTDLPRRTNRAFKGRTTETSMPSKSGVRRLDEASNATILPQSQHPRLLLYQKHPKSKSQATTTIRGKQSANKCESCGRKYQTRAGLIYHREHHPNCDSTLPRSYNSKKRKLNGYSNPGYTQLRADRQGPFANPPAPRDSFPNLMPSETLTALPQVARKDNPPALEDVSLGPAAEGAEGGRQKVRKDKSQIHAEQSARALRVCANRRALGTNGRDGGPPKSSSTAKKAKVAAPNTAPNLGTSLAPSVTEQSGHSQDPSQKQTQPIVFEKEVRRDANQNKQSVAQIIPAAPEIHSGLKRIKPPKMHGAKHHTCRKCGMSYADRSYHYRVLPNIGSEHKRRMAANKAAAKGHSGPAVTDVGVESTSDIQMGQMIFEISSREQSPELSREDKELLGEVVE